MISLFKRSWLPRDVVEECLDYYEKNDIFLNKSKEYNLLKGVLLSNKKIKFNDMKQFVAQTRNNMYTEFSFYKKKNYKNHSFDIITDIYFKKVLYVKFSLWDKLSPIKFMKILDSINKDFLIIDLRSCTGGYLKSCLEICNMLLPECEIVSLNYKRKIVTHYSDEYYYKFKKIFIMLDKSTASSCEILAYSLYTNLNNVILLGEPTFKKTFGQDYIINKKYNFYFLVPTFKWFIKDFSFDSVYIKPLNSSFLSQIEPFIN